MTSMMQAPIRKLGALSLALTCAAGALLAGCSNPKQDDFKSEGGISPDPTGIIAGSILYSGPRPSCDYTDGRPTRVRGRVLLTLFQFDNPPPPEGRATSALNLNAINGGDLFSLGDCRPMGQPVDPAERITRSLAYSWPQIELGPKGGSDVVYQIRGFYDADEDMNPFFSVKNLPTAGDIAGAALVDAQDPSKGFLRIKLPSVDKARDGFRRSGVIVSLGNYVWLERPAFELSEQNRYLEAEATVISSQRADGSPNTTAIVAANWRRLCETSGQSDCGFRLQQLVEEDVERTFEAADVQLDFDPERYAFVSEPVDILTVVPDGPDLARPDGIADPHPLLGGNAFAPWFTPLVIMTRAAPSPAQAAIEARAGIPNVRLIGSVLLDEAGTGPIRRSHLGDVEISVAPIAAVELGSGNPQCRVPYIAAGNYTVAYENRFTYCHKLPTGIFGVSTIQGVAGGQRLPAPEGTESDNGLVWEGGRLSGQAWTLPNDLANPEQVGPGNELPSQGLQRLFVVHETEVDDPGDCTQAPDPLMNLRPRPINPRGICADGEPLTVENEVGFDGQACLPEACCEGVRHLCGVSLCEECTEESCGGIDLGGRFVRGSPTEIVGTGENGMGIPNCVPFEVPELCCS